jgi:electron transfer flavoprotein beta subunit
LREAVGASAEASVEAFTMGPPQAREVLVEALNLGLDRAFHLCHPALAGADSLATARALAGAFVLAGPYDLLVFGEKSTDGGTGQVGPAVAALLGRPFLGRADELAPAGPGRLTVRQSYSRERLWVQASLPAVVSVLREAFVPRLPSLRARLRPKEVRALGLDDLPDPNPLLYGEKGSPTRIKRIFRPLPEKKGEARRLGAPEAARVILEAMDSLERTKPDAD